MKNWKKNAILTSVLVFVCVGVYLNWNYTQDNQAPDLVETLNKEKVMSGTQTVMSGNPAGEAAAREDLQVGADQTTDYFAAVRLSRQESRDSAVTTIQEAMAYGEDNDPAMSGKLEDLVDTALCEAQIESLVIAKGYTDCVAYMNKDGISVAVAAPDDGLKEDDVALISDIVLTQAECSLEDIRIIEVQS